MSLRTRWRVTPHDRQWRAHPAVPTGGQLSFGERMADQLKRLVATWTALILVLVAIMWWLYAGGIGGSDAPGFLHLNLALSCFAALQCFILLIAAKRADQIAAAIALHTLENTQAIRALLQQNTDLTEQVAALTREMHAHITGDRMAPSAATMYPAVTSANEAVAMVPAMAATVPAKRGRAARQSGDSNGA